MYTWNIHLTDPQKNKEKYTIWKLEQMVNFGLGGKKIKRSQLKKYWDRLDLDPGKKKFLSLLLWGQQS